MVELGGRRIGVDDVHRVAVQQELVTLDADALERLQASAAYAEKVALTRPIYGRSTGVGANRDIEVDMAGHPQALMRSHATGAGEFRSPERVRAMTAVRVAQLLAGGNGVRPIAVEALVRQLNVDQLPEVRERGSLGTADLGALAALGSWLLDLPGGPYLSPGEGLAFISSNAGAIGDALLGLHDLRELTRAGLAIATLTLRAVDGSLEAFAPGVAVASPFPGARWACLEVTRLSDQLPPWSAARIQDPFCLRTVPQVHGALADTISHTLQTVEAMANAPSENPLLSEEHGVAHHGAFHAVYLGLALDSLRNAVAQAAQLSLGRLVALSDPAMTGLEPFTADRPGGSGSMMVEYAAADALTRLRLLAGPTGTQSVSLSRGVEDDASFAGHGAVYTLESVQLFREVLAAELLVATRALTLRGLRVPWVELGGTQQAAFIEGDRDLTADLQLAHRIVPELAGLVASFS